MRPNKDGKSSVLPLPEEIKEYLNWMYCLEHGMLIGVLPSLIIKDLPPKEQDRLMRKYGELQELVLK